MNENTNPDHLGFAKLEITGTLRVLTGMHIGTGGGFSAIGAVDKAVVRDPLTRLPLLPGTSLKGKMRTLLSRQSSADSGRFADKPDNDEAKIRRLFGDTNEYMAGRLIFRDSVLANKPELEERGARTVTEVKFENTINRITAIANPRQMERVIPGSEFRFQLVYEVAFGTRGSGPDGRPGPATMPSAAEISEDFALIATGLRLLELDYLGGSGTRGYGRVKFVDLEASVPVGSIEDGLLAGLNGELAAISRAG